MVMVRCGSGVRPQGCALTAKSPQRATAHRAKSALYVQALQLARGQQYDVAREAFQTATFSAPDECKAWVAWAQMEKRAEKVSGTDEAVSDAVSDTLSDSRRRSLKFMRCRAVLQRGLQLNPGSACLLQAWGLLELQSGNTFAALALLEQSVRADSSCSPVLRWRAVQAARLARSTRHKQPQPLAASSSAVPNGC